MPKPLDYFPPYLPTGRVDPRLARTVNLSGAYVIRDRSTGAVFYVGESHTGRLKKTVLRHFQFWTGPTAGPTYNRNRVEIALRVTPPASAVSAQDNLICRLSPRDNEIKTRCPNPF